MQTEFFTLEMLITFAGCVLATGVLTQMLKKAGLFLNVPAQVVSYVIAFAVLIVANLALGTFTWSGLVLMVFNAAVVALSSNGGYDAVTSIVNYNESLIELREKQIAILEANSDSQKTE